MTPHTIRAQALRAGVVLALAGAALTSTAPSADAGTYVVYGCKTLPTGGEGGTGVWAMTQRYSARNTFKDCRPGSAADPIVMEFDPTRTHPADDEMNLTFLAPADTSIQDFKIWRSVALGTAYNSRLFELKSSGGTAEMDRCYPSDGCTEKGSFGNWTNNSNEISGWGRTDVRGLQIRITCGNSDSGSSACPDQSPAALYHLHRSDIRLVDNHEPVVTGVSGGLASGAPVAGAQSLSFSAADRGGGIHEAWLVVDGANQPRAVVDANGGACSGRPWRAAVPCKLSASGTLNLDTTKLKDGTHQVKLMVSDVTGTNIAGYGPINVKVDNARSASMPPGGTAACNPQPAVAALSMRAGFSGRKGKRTLRTTMGRKPRIRGQLRSPSGAPVPGASICVLVREQVAGARTRDGGNLVTDGKGRFSYRLPPGVSRAVTFVHRVGGGAVTATVRAHVRAPIQLRVSRRSVSNGQSVLFRGALGARAKRGMLVELQWRPGKKWQTFRTVRTNSDGRFRSRYRFSRTSVTRRYALRARVPRQQNLPFTSGASRALRVTVHG